MNNRLLKNISMIAVCLVLTFVYFQYQGSNDTPKDKKTKNPVNYQTVVLKDKEDTLVPVEVDMQIEAEPDQLYRNMLHLMQSNDYKDKGLYPLLPKDLEVNGMEIENKILTIDFNDSLNATSNEDALDILEGLSYTFCGDEVDSIHLKIDGKDISNIPNSTIPTACMSKNLGINNFESDTNNIYRTVPVVVYNQKTIEGTKYYVPVTMRVESEPSDLNNQVSLLLNKIDYQEPVELVNEIQLQDGILQVSVGSNILLDNETIDSALYERLVKSLNSLPGVEKVSIYVDNQEQNPTTDVSSEINNRIKM